VRLAGRLDGTLTGPASGPAAPIGLRWVRAHRAELGLTLADLETLGKPTVRSEGGIRQVRWPQEVDGVKVADAELRVNVGEDGRLINVMGSPVRASELPRNVKPRRPRPRGDAELTIFENRLAYRYMDGDHDTVVDADTGETLRRRSIVKRALVWDNHPSLNVPAKPFDLSVWQTESNRLRNPWMHVKRHDKAPTGLPEDVVPGDYEFVSVPGAGCTSARPCSWSGASKPNLNQNAVQAYYLANVFREHLAAPPFSFNFHKDGTLDQLIIETSDGAGTNNAEMATPRPGGSPRMQMYLWGGGPFRNVNGGDDASILWHEYAHGLTERSITDSSGLGALWEPQGYSMGEGWSDFFAKDLLVEQGHEVDSDQPGEIDMGNYTDVNPVSSSAMRFQAIDCTVGAPAAQCPAGASSGPGGFTFGDFGRIFGTGNGRHEPHADGEIWAQTLWDLRTAIGATEARRLIASALGVTKPEPTFLDGRDAILQVDQATGGQFKEQIWRVFAARGMGVNARANVPTAPVEDFTALPNTTITAKPPALSNLSTVSFTFSGTTGSTFECSLDGSPFASCTSGQSWSVSEGTHTFLVRAVNVVGPDDTPAGYTFTVDRTPPRTMITEAPPPFMSTRSGSVSFTATEPATFRCSLDDQPSVACTSPFAWSGLADGAHVVAVRAIDLAGNADPDLERIEFMVASSEPVPTPTSTPTPTPTATATATPAATAAPLPLPSPTPVPTAIPTPSPKPRALASASAPKTVALRTGKVKLTLRGQRGAKVTVQAKLGSRVVGKATKRLRGTRLSFQLKLDKKRLKARKTVSVRVKASGSGLTTVTRTVKLRVR
jgi:hypothetical protein